MCILMFVCSLLFLYVYILISMCIFFSSPIHKIVTSLEIVNSVLNYTKMIMKASINDIILRSSWDRVTKLCGEMARGFFFSEV